MDGKKYSKENETKKQAGIAIPISDKTEFKQKLIIRRVKEGQTFHTHK